MPIPEYQPPRGSTAVFSSPWLRYEPVSGFRRYYEGYLATVIGWWNGAFELTLDRDSVTALAQTFGAMANYVGRDWRTVDFDGHTLTILSLGGGVHLLQPSDGRYRIGWGPAVAAGRPEPLRSPLRPAVAAHPSRAGRERPARAFDGVPRSGHRT